MEALVLFSGGLDSTTCLALAVKKHGSKNVIAMSLNYGQKHRKEIRCAENIAKNYGVNHIKYDVADLFKNSGCSLLDKSDNGVPEKSYEEQLKETSGDPVSTYVPYRNGLFLSMAASVALSNKCRYVYYGAHKDDATGSAYPDCSEKFNKAISEAINIGTSKKITVIAPFISKDKAEIVKLGLSLKVPYELTWSCYKGEEKPCGKCGTCIDRLRAFEANNVKDPLKY